MTPAAWLIVAAALAVGIGIGALLHRRNVARTVVGSTLVPHRTREVLSVLQSGAVVVRRDRRSAFSNTTASALAVARPDGALHPGVADLAERAWRADAPVEEDVEIKRGVLGSSSIVHVRVTPLNSELALAVANDNTEQRAAEATRREFAVNVSHELKTPVGALSLLAETIEDNAEDTEMVRSFAKKIRKETRRLTKLIQEIIEISRLQGGESVMDYAPVDLAGVVAEVIDSVRMSADAKEIALVPEYAAAPEVMGDHDLLVMAVRNLVDNAINYSEPGKRVTVSLAREEGVARLAVIDQGLGIALEDQERIFERFYRTDPARSRDTGGTGLGLSIVKHVVLQHSGTVDLWSQPSVGSTFTIRLASDGDTADAGVADAAPAPEEET
ncbi:sensor histidine kinase [Demequina activiva]|uniref:Sensor-like histidine kinase SenX3 n=1 Tax=Demequina activiva TaxID=1582364 RepID=A0A919Q154_9MICO|nr:ATP-binding protein [Demequina activiva]GIG53729.1 signal-transduction histidine kinase senX3 [Demequina activiva]